MPNVHLAHVRKDSSLTFEGPPTVRARRRNSGRLAAWLQARAAKEPLLVTRQPGGTKTGDRIRALLLDSKTEALDPRTELGLMFADRAQSIAEVRLRQAS